MCAVCAHAHVCMTGDPKEAGGQPPVLFLRTLSTLCFWDKGSLGGLEHTD